jgi:membrane protease subunit HflC
MNKKLSMALLLAAAGFLALLFASLVVVDETEVALPVRFGRISGEPMKPGLHLIAPRPVGSVFRIDRRKLLIRIPPTEFLSVDKKNLLLDFAAVYRIEEPALFLQRVRDVPGAESRLVDLSISALGAIAGRSPAEAFFSIDAEKVKLLALSEEVRTSVDAAAKGFGIRVDSAWITQVHFPYQNREAIVSRMRAERDRIARRLRSEGEEAAQKIEAEAEQEKRRLLAEAARDAEVTRGKGDADAARLYAQAYRLDPKLYEFIRALSAYEKMAGKETTLFLDADGPAMRLLTRGPNAEVPNR